MKRLSLLIGLVLLHPMYCPAMNTMDVDIHGFISQGYIRSQDNNFFSQSQDGTFEFNEMGINFVTTPAPNLRVGLQLFAHDLGGYGNDQVMVDWVVGDYRIDQKLGIRVGKIKVPVGFYNTTRDIDMLNTGIFMPQSVYPEEQRDANLAIKGGGLYGDISLGRFGSLEYEGVYGTIQVDDDTIGTKIAEDQGGLINARFSFDYKYAAGLIWNTPAKGLRLGGTYQYASFKIIGDLEQIDLLLTMDNTLFYAYTMSAEYAWDRLLITYELMQRHWKFDVHPILIQLDEKAMGQYVKASYAFTDGFELSVYYSEFYPRKDDRNGSNVHIVSNEPYGNRAWFKDWVVSMRFNLSSSWTMKLEGHYIDGAAGLLTRDNPNGFERYWNMYAIKMAYNF